VSELLCGTYYPSIDAKGRMSFPNKLREKLGAELYLCIGHDDHYIAVYSAEEFEEYQKKLFTIAGSKGAAIRRKLLSGADKQVPDKQGRIFITQLLRDHAFITDEVVVVGSANRAEIWSKTRWDEFNDGVSMDEINEALSELVL